VTVFAPYLCCNAVDTVADLPSRWRRNADEAGSSDRRPQSVDTEANMSSTVRPPTATSLSSPVSNTHLPDVDDRPVAVDPASSGLLGEMRRNPLKDVGAFVIILTAPSHRTAIAVMTLMSTVIHTNDRSIIVLYYANKQYKKNGKSSLLERYFTKLNR